MSAAAVEMARLALSQLSRKERAELIREMSGPRAMTTQPLNDRIIRRIEAAGLLGRSTRAVDRFCVEGILHRVRLPGRTRAAGFRLSEIMQLVGGRS